MPEFDSFQELRLRGGFILVRLEFVQGTLVDPIGRPALAKTQILGREFYITVFSGLSEMEKSVTLYHEILEAMTIATFAAPLSVQNFNEGDFERAAYRAYELMGAATPANVDRMLQFYGFPGE